MKNSITRSSKHRRAAFTNEFYRQDLEDLQLADIKATADDGQVVIVPINHSLDELDNIDKLLIDTGFDKQQPGLSGQDDSFAVIENINLADVAEPALAAANSHEQANNSHRETIASEQPSLTETVPGTGATGNDSLTRLTAWLAGASLVGVVYLGWLFYEVKTELIRVNAQLSELKATVTSAGGQDQRPPSLP